MLLLELVVREATAWHQDTMGMVGKALSWDTYPHYLSYYPLIFLLQNMEVLG